jgi:hypothetical protein
MKELPKKTAENFPYIPLVREQFISHIELEA